MTDLNTNNLSWPISQALIDIIQRNIKECSGACIVSFRNLSYSASNGGFHPVEISVGEDGNILYITDFSYVGQHPFEELVKEIDWDFGTGSFQHMGREFPIEAGRDLFKIWQSNFTLYFKMGVFGTSTEEI